MYSRGITIGYVKPPSFNICLNLNSIHEYALCFKLLGPPYFIKINILVG